MYSISLFFLLYIVCYEAEGIYKPYFILKPCCNVIIKPTLYLLAKCALSCQDCGSGILSIGGEI